MSLSLPFRLPLHQANWLAYKLVKGVFPIFPIASIILFRLFSNNQIPTLYRGGHSRSFVSLCSFFLGSLSSPNCKTSTCVSGPLALLPRVVVVRSSDPLPRTGHVFHLILSCLVARSHVSDFVPRLSLSPVSRLLSESPSSRFSDCMSSAGAVCLIPRR